MFGFKFAGKGLKYAFSTQTNLKIHFLFAVAVMVAGFFFHISLTEWISILICIALVLSLELLNTAIELLVDMVQPEFHYKAGRIKDVSAGAVLVSAVISAIVGMIIFVPKLIDFIGM